MSIPTVLITLERHIEIILLADIYSLYTQLLLISIVLLSLPVLSESKGRRTYQNNKI
jgi:hypothetical protein